MCGMRIMMTKLAVLVATDASGTIKVIRELSTIGNASNRSNSDDRTYVPLGSSNISTNGAFLRCSAEQPGTSSLAAPNVIWLKDGTQLSGDGVRVVINTTTTAGT